MKCHYFKDVKKRCILKKLEFVKLVCLFLVFSAEISNNVLLITQNQEQYDKSGNCRSDLTAERNRENGGDDCDRIIHGKCKRVDGCGKRGVLARVR